ncbi:MAG: hypothetical protein IH830_10090 [Planctomycetes bacterium]|nr:hypothetical protein [Planctomycetota bacterium]
MKRRLFTLALFLLLGAVVNVAVAWGCGLWSIATPTDVWFQTPPNDQARLLAKGWKPSPNSQPQTTVRRGFGVYRLDYREWSWPPFSPSSLSASGMMVGWPFWCLSGEVIADQHDPANFEVALLISMRPIWDACIANAVFYAVILAILLHMIRAPRTLRRLIRRKRGLCVACGYDLRHADHDACPECGAGYSTDGKGHIAVQFPP